MLKQGEYFSSKRGKNSTESKTSFLSSAEQKSVSSAYDTLQNNSGVDSLLSSASADVPMSKVAPNSGTGVSVTKIHFDEKPATASSSPTVKADSSSAVKVDRISKSSKAGASVDASNHKELKDSQLPDSAPVQPRSMEASSHQPKPKPHTAKISASSDNIATEMPRQGTVDVVRVKRSANPISSTQDQLNKSSASTVNSTSTVRRVTVVKIPRRN